MSQGVAFGLLIGITSVVLLGCGSDATTPEAKRRQIERLRAEIARLQQQLEALERRTGQLSTTSAEVSVVVESVSVGPLRRLLEVPGAVESRTTVTLSAKSAGSVTAVYVQPGMRVVQGQVLIELDAEVVRRTIEEVETQRDLAKTLYERYRRAWEAQAVAEVQYLSAKQQWEALERRLATLREQLAQARITAPMAGIVDEVFVKNGELLVPGAPAVRLVNTRNLFVAADVSEAYAGTLRAGGTAEVVFPELGDTVRARLRSVGQAINVRTRTFRIELVLDRLPEGIRPGLHCSVRIADVERAQAVTIPLAALQRRNGKPIVYVVERQAKEAIVRERSVRIGVLTFERAEILSGLRPGEEVVVRAAGPLQDGMRVKL